MTHSKRKGGAFEREIVNWFRERDVPAKRVPLSGAAEGYKDDIVFGPEFALSGECKRFANGLSKLYGALGQGEADFVFARADRKPTLVCMNLETFERLICDMGWLE